MELRLSYPDASSAVISVGWGMTPPARRAILDFSGATVVYDDRASGPKVHVFSPRAATGSAHGSPERPLKRGVDTADGEPLERAVRHFFAALTTDESPITSSMSALRVARILDAGRESLASGGDDVMPEVTPALR